MANLNSVIIRSTHNVITHTKNSRCDSSKIIIIINK